VHTGPAERHSALDAIDQALRESDIHRTFVDHGATSVAMQTLEEASSSPSATSRTHRLHGDPQADATAVEGLFPSQRDLDVDILTPTPDSSSDWRVQVRPWTAKELLDEGRERKSREGVARSPWALCRHKRFDWGASPSERFWPYSPGRTLSPFLLTREFGVVDPATCRIAQYFIGLPDGQEWFTVLSRAIGVILLCLPTIS
jgi:hypothetical protein